MHCVKLGVGHYVIGSCLVLFAKLRCYRWLGPAVVEELSPDAPFSAILDDLTLRFTEWCKDHGLQCSVKRFTPGRVHREAQTTYRGGAIRGKNLSALHPETSIAHEGPALGHCLEKGGRTKFLSLGCPRPANSNVFVQGRPVRSAGRLAGAASPSVA